MVSDVTMGFHPLENLDYVRCPYMNAGQDSTDDADRGKVAE